MFSNCRCCYTEITILNFGPHLHLPRSEQSDPKAGGFSTALLTFLDLFEKFLALSLSSAAVVWVADSISSSFTPWDLSTGLIPCRIKLLSKPVSTLLYNRRETRTSSCSISPLDLDIKITFSLSSKHLRIKSNNYSFGIWVIEVNCKHKSVELFSSWWCCKYPISVAKMRLVFITKMLLSLKPLCMLLITLLPM